ncbi:glycine cleavage system aminomethyltransferase GcvT [Subtercola boreus]|uniref:Aminomethyltransferase n=1 Tax=Subtercola boreus TaxID=120213 RepID=A0A3E0WC74_9MICO|nr:glycine cleavage system aminomethyltransferase GcvT [Subtercola boreus]RFA20000.1 glycine cleavage system protein T [Subtercola boreus]RFA20129.1 glycine cleavage system protein T [Subtercola boreus]RFA26456.1 glycine cleavage system protein T [Subtercola boreus]
MPDSPGQHAADPQPVIASPDATLLDATATPSEPLVLSPLNEVHVAAGAGFTDFAGWQMPVRYSSDLAEHRAVRESAGIFDLSHMAEIRVQGPEAAAFLDYALAGRLSAIAIGQAKYSLLLTPDAGIVDDLVVYRRGDTDFLVVANAGNQYQALGALLERAASFDTSVTDESDDTALIAVQGPKARAIVQAVPGIHFLTAPAGAPDDRLHPLDTLKYYWSVDAEYAGQPLFVARTGYTGEDGFELYVPAALASALWRDLVIAGEPHGLVPAGLASRDTLRLEAGMPLYGHELGLDTKPAQAGLGRVPNLAKGDFVGREALERDAANDTAVPGRVLVGLVGEGKRAARADYEIFAPATSGADAGADPGAAAAAADAAAPVGLVTSGVLSPTLGHPVAMAYVDPAFAAVGTEVAIDIRGKRLAFRVTTLPFYRRERD